VTDYKIRLIILISVIKMGKKSQKKPKRELDVSHPIRWELGGSNYQIMQIILESIESSKSVAGDQKSPPEERKEGTLQNF